MLQSWVSHRTKQEINIQAAESLHFMEYKVINAEGEEIQRKPR